MTPSKYLIESLHKGGELLAALAGLEFLLRMRGGVRIWLRPLGEGNVDVGQSWQMICYACDKVRVSEGMPPGTRTFVDLHAIFESRFMGVLRDRAVPDCHVAVRAGDCLCGRSYYAINVTVAGKLSEELKEVHELLSNKPPEKEASKV